MQEKFADKFKYGIAYEDGVTTLVPMDGSGTVVLRGRDEAEVFVRRVLKNYSSEPSKGGRCGGS